MRATHPTYSPFGNRGVVLMDSSNDSTSALSLPPVSSHFPQAECVQLISTYSLRRTSVTILQLQLRLELHFSNRLENFMAIRMRIAVSWYLTPYNVENLWTFRKNLMTASIFYPEEGGSGFRSLTTTIFNQILRLTG